MYFFDFETFNFHFLFENPLKWLKNDAPTAPKASRTNPKILDFFNCFDVCIVMVVVVVVVVVVAAIVAVLRGSCYDIWPKSMKLCISNCF